MAYLILKNGAVFEGKRIGAAVDCVGDLVFTTGVVGYIETLTDPANAGQIVLQTFPQIGNYGVATADVESEYTAAGYVVRDLCDTPSNFRSEGALDEFLKEKGIGGICGVDTREITRILRDEGTMTAWIVGDVPADLSALPEKTALQPKTVTLPTIYPAVGDKRYDVTVVDFGVKASLIGALCDRGCEVTVVPATLSAEDILAADPDGVVFSDGPGDPTAYEEGIALAKELMGKTPLLGIGLGHQLVALAMGGRTLRLPYGHRGANQPVKEVVGVRTYITSQNHGYAVDADVLPTGATMTYVNLNDHTCEGLIYNGQGCMTLQFQPDNDKGPQSTAFLWDGFVMMMGGETDAER